MRRKKLLIVDDEETIVLSLFRELYRDNEYFDTLVAGSAKTAQQILRENEIELLLTDIRLPGMSGMDLVCWAATESPGTSVMVMTAYEIDSLRDRAYRFGCLQIVQKPFDLHQMRSRLVRALSRRESLAGNLSELSPADVIQMLCLCQKSAALRVVDGNDWGLVHIENGEIVHAIWNDDVGEPAFYSVLQATQGMFNTLPLPEDTPRTIVGDWRHLLIEGMRLEDEGDRGDRSDDAVLAGFEPGESLLGGPAPSAEPALTPSEQWDAAVARERNHADAEAEVAVLIDVGFQRLRDRDYDGARAVWNEALDLAPGNRMLELNLRRLDKLHSD